MQPIKKDKELSVRCDVLRDHKTKRERLEKQADFEFQCNFCNILLCSMYT